jgi:hypothetical protein
MLQGQIWPHACEANGESAARTRQTWRSSCSRPDPRRPTRWPVWTPGRTTTCTKPFSVVELLARIRAVLRRKAPRGARFRRSRSRACAWTRPRGASRAATQEVKIGPTEFRLLHFFMTHTERVHSRTQLLRPRLGRPRVHRGAHRGRPRQAPARGPRTGAMFATLIETVRGAGLSPDAASRSDLRLSARVIASPLTDRETDVSWLLNRAMLTILFTLVGAWIGAIVGNVVDARQLGPALGAALAVAVCVLIDGAARAAPDGVVARRPRARGAARPRLLG